MTEARQSDDTGSSTPILYILMRTDLASMNPGKAIAQGSHAANMFAHQQTMHHAKGDPSALYWKWATSAQGFGICIVLDAGTEENITRLVAKAHARKLHAGVVFDPTYPLRDGDVTHLIPLNTCAFIFGTRDDAGDVVADLSLMP